MTNINTINEIITDIITNRHKSIQDKDNTDGSLSDNDNQNEQNKAISKKVDDLPAVMISEITSYLSFHESLQFEKCNRSVFIGSRSSNLPIYSLDDYFFTKFVTFYQKNPENNSHKSKRFKSVTLNLQNINLDIVFHFNLFKYIQTLEIYSDSESDLGPLLVCLNKRNDLSNIKTLKMVIEDYIAAEPQYMLQSIMKNNMKLQFFDYSGCAYDRPFDAEWVSKLKGISMRDYERDCGPFIYPAIGKDLESLHIWAEPLTTELKGKLNKLKEFCYCSFGEDEEEFEILLKQEMEHLKRLHFRPYSVPLECLKVRDLRQLLFNKVIKTAEYICLDVDRSDVELFNVLAKSLEHCRSDTVKIRINNINLNENNRFDFGGFIESLINGMETRCSNWMFIVQSLCIRKMISINNINNFVFGKKHFIETKVGYDDKISSESLLEKLLELIKSKYCVQFKNISNNQKYNKYNFVISNNGCNINGYKERWTMECEGCVQPPIFD